MAAFYAVQRPVDIKNRPRIPIPDEDPYSVAGNGVNGSGSSGSSGFNGNGNGVNGTNGHGIPREPGMIMQGQRRGDKPPKLPPRENGMYPHDIPKVNYNIFCHFNVTLIVHFVR